MFKILVSTAFTNLRFVFFLKTVQAGDTLYVLSMAVYTVWVKKNPPCGFLTFFPNGWELISCLHTYYMFFSTLGYKFLFNYLQLLRSYAILSETTQRIIYISLEL